MLIFYVFRRYNPAELEITPIPESGNNET